MAKEKTYRKASDTAKKMSGDFKPTTVDAPEGMSFFKLKEGKMTISILPYEVGKGNPNADKGETHWERTYHVHRNIGAKEQMVVCPAETIDEPCPICEARAKMKKKEDADEDVVKSLRPGKRQLFLIFDHNDEDAGLQLADLSMFVFGDAIKEAIDGLEDDDKEQFFYRTGSKGCALKLVVKEEKGGGFKFLKVTSVRFIDRPSDLPDEVKEKAASICLDEILIIKPYDELKEMFEQSGGGDDEDEDDKKSSKKKSKKDDDDDDDDDKKSSKKKDDDDDDDDDKKKSKKDDDDDDDDDDDKKSSKKSKSKDDDDDDDDDDKKSKKDDDDDDDDDDKKSSKKSSKDDDDDDEDEKKDKKSKKDDDDDDDWDKDDKKSKSKDDDDDDDDDDKKSSKKSKKDDDDDDDDEDDKKKSKKKDKEDDDD